MTGYDKLLDEGMKHINRANSETQLTGLGIGGDRRIRIPAKSKNHAHDFELVTWLIILNKDTAV